MQELGEKVILGSCVMYESLCLCLSLLCEGGIAFFGDHRGSILSNRAEISQEG